MFSYNAALGAIALSISICVLAFFYYWWWDRLKKRFPAPVPATQVSVLEVDELERSIGGKLPAVLRAAYLDGNIIRLRLPVTFQCHGMEFTIIGFIAVNAASNKKLVGSSGIPARTFIFASDDFGNYYFVKASEDAIYFWDHDGGDVAKLFGTAEDFWMVIE